MESENLLGGNEEIRSVDFLLTDYILPPLRTSAVVPHHQSEEPGSSCRKSPLSLTHTPCVRCQYLCHMSHSLCHMSNFLEKCHTSRITDRFVGCSLIRTLVERFSVSCIQDFFLNYLFIFVGLWLSTQHMGNIVQEGYSSYNCFCFVLFTFLIYLDHLFHIGPTTGYFLF